MEVFGERLGQSSSTEDFEDRTADSLGGTGVINDNSPGERPGQCCYYWSDTKRWPIAVLSSLGALLAVSASGALCALLYPVLKELRAERVTGEDGTEVRILGFWSILVLSVLAGCVCCVFSCTLTYLDSYKPGMVLPQSLALPHLRHVQGQSFHVGYAVALLNGIMASLAVIWSLT
ncbi:ADP-ribosylation factor-like protein 6-interacting protein 6 [Polymixia lowei]